MPFFQNEGLKLFYTDSGTHTPERSFGAGKVPTVLIHGWLCDSDDWIYQIPIMSRRARTVTTDLRGHGRSSSPATGYTPDAMAQDVVALIQLLGLGRLVLIGHSAGAEVAVAAAELLGDSVAALVAVDPAYGQAPEHHARYADMVRRSQQKDGAEFASAFFRSLEGPNTPDHLREWHSRRPLGIPDHVRWQSLSDFSFGDGSLRLQPASDVRLRNRTAPLFALHRTRERAEADLRLSRHPLSRAIVYEDTGHWPHQEDPLRFEDDLRSWLSLLS